MNEKKKIIVSVTNDLSTDQRVHKMCTTLHEMGFEVLLVGRKLPTSFKTVERPYTTIRWQLWFNKGPLFYLNYNIRLLFFLLFEHYHVLWSNDLDTLPANFIASKLRKKSLVFDSHEYFSEVPELVNRPVIRGIWKTMENVLFPKLNNTLTVSPAIAKEYHNNYGIEVKVVRNVPYLQSSITADTSLKETNKKIVVYQGSVNMGRGIEKMVEAMKYLNDVVLHVIGDGDIFDRIQQQVSDQNLKDKVKLLGRIPYKQLKAYTQQADLGLSLEEDLGLNYRYALPNKIFDYIHANVPVLTSDLPEMGQIIRNYNVGAVIKTPTAEQLAQKIQSMLDNKEGMREWKKNTQQAALELCWEKESVVIQDLLMQVK